MTHPSRSLPLLLAAAAATSAALAAPSPPASPTSSAQATPTPPKSLRDELPAEAIKAWDSAVELYDARDYEGARIQFVKAHELSRNPKVLFNVGVCDKSLRRYARAAAMWKRELTEGGAALDDAERAKVEGAIQTVEQFVSAVRVQASQDGATLTIDGELAGTTPLAKPLAVDIGRHTLVLQKEGFVALSRELTVGSETAEVRLELVPVGAPVEVTVAGPDQASVFVDGTDMGAAPFRGDVTAGRRTFEARAPGYVTTRQTSVVEPGRPLRIALVLGSEQREGKLRVAASEADAAILVDGEEVGTGSWEGVVPSGGHRLLVQKDGFAAQESDVSLAAGQARTIDVTLERQADAFTWVWWTAGGIGVATAAIIASYFVLSPAERTPVSGTLTPGIVQTGLGAGAVRSWSFSLGGSF